MNSGMQKTECRELSDAELEAVSGGDIKGAVGRTDAAATALAKRIIALAQQGERDPVRLRERAVQGLSARRAG
jgi:hypothetical protein